jgi:predicted DNA-binding transcriptional regulator AlpA
MEIVPGDLYTAREFADHLKVSIDSLYQSLPGQNSRCKLGVTLPYPLRIGRSLRWRGIQIIEYVNYLERLSNKEKAPQILLPETRPKIRRGRPRKTELCSVGQGECA